MRGARLHAAGDLRVEDLPEPEPREGHSLVAVRSVGLCGSDLHWFGEGGIGDARLSVPLVPGHEVGGVALDGPYAGRVVAVDPAIPCGRCARCIEGHHNLCPGVRFAGHAGLDGGLVERLSWPTDRLVPLPDGMTSDDAAMLEPLGVAVHAWGLADVPLAARIAVVGTGPIGLFLVQLAARGLSSHVTAVEPLEHRRRAASEQGADEVLTPSEVTNELNTHDVVFEVSGHPDAVRASLQLARPGARVCLVGIPDDDTTTFPASLARRKGLTIMVVRRMGEVYPAAIALARRGIVDLASVVTDHVALADAPAGFARAASRVGLKTIVHPG